MSRNLTLVEEERWVPVAESGARWAGRSKQDALEDQLRYPAGGTFSDGEPWDGIVEIVRETRWVSAWTEDEVL